VLKRKKERECEANHWFVQDGQLMLSTPTEAQQELAKQVIKVLEKQIRLRIAEDITKWKPLENRAQIIKVAGSLDAALVGVQAICADIAMGKENDGTE
jgi:fumarate hydratase class II